MEQELEFLTELVVCSCTRIYYVVSWSYYIYILLQNVVHFPILSGMTELECLTKLVLPSNLVPTIAMTQGITNRSL